MLVPIHPENLAPLQAQLDTAGIPVLPLLAAGSVFLLGSIIIGVYLQRGRTGRILTGDVPVDADDTALLDAIDQDPELAPHLPDKRG